MHRGSREENPSPKLLTGKRRGAAVCEVLQPAGLRDWSLEVHSAPVEKGRWTGGRQHHLTIPLGEVAPPWSTSGRGGIASRGTKELVGAITLSCPSAWGQRHLDTSSLLRFLLYPEFHHRISGTNLYHARLTKTLPPRNQHGSLTSQVPKVWSFTTQLARLG